MTSRETPDHFTCHESMRPARDRFVDRALLSIAALLATSTATVLVTVVVVAISRHVSPPTGGGH